ASGNRGIVDRLNVNAVVMKQAVGGGLAGLRVSYHHGDDMGWRFENRQAGPGEHRLDPRDTLLLLLPFPRGMLEVPHGSRCRCRDARRNGGGEDEARSETAHGVN